MNNNHISFWAALGCFLLGIVVVVVVAIVWPKALPSAWSKVWSFLRLGGRKAKAAGKAVWTTK